MNQLYSVADVVEPSTWDKLKTYGRPRKVGNITPPEDLYHLTYGELIELQEIAKNNDIPGMCRLLLGLDGKEFCNANAAEVMAFAYWATAELERIAKLFADIKVEPDADQKKAGVDELSFGIFGTLDWYCLRMGITDHEVAEKVKWIRIYKCMVKDNEIYKFNKRLQKVYEDKNKMRQQQAKRARR